MCITESLLCTAETGTLWINQTSIFYKLLKPMPPLSGWLLLFKKKKENNKCWQRWGETETLAYHWWERKWWICYRKERRFFKGVKTRTTTWSSSSTWGILHQKELKAGSWRNPHTSVHNKYPQQSRSRSNPSVHWWLNAKMQCILQWDIIQPLKGRKSCYLWNKHRYCMCTVWFHLFEASKVVKFIGTESRTVTTRRRGEGKGGTELQVCKISLEIYFSMTFIHLTPLTHTLKNS